MTCPAAAVPDIVNELRAYGIEALIHDQLADPAEAVGNMVSNYGYGATSVASIPTSWRLPIVITQS